MAEDDAKLHLYGVQLKIVSGRGNLLRQVVFVSRNVWARNHDEAHHRALTYALDLGLGQLLADEDARVTLDISLGMGVFP